MWRQQARWQQRQARRASAPRDPGSAGSLGSSGSQSGDPAHHARHGVAGSQRGASAGARGPWGHRGRGRGRGRPGGRGRGGRIAPDVPREPALAKPWIDLGLESQMRQLDSLLVNAKQSRQAADMDQYLLQRDKVQSIEEHKRMAYFAAHPDEEEFWLPRLAVEAGRVPQYCEMCELNFDSAQALSQHEQDHETCGLDGCTFTASPEQLETHIVDLHASGLYARTCHGKSDVEVEAWRAQRKRAWPTYARTQQEVAKKIETLRRVEEREERLKAEQALINEWVQKRKRDMEMRRQEIDLIRQREGWNALDSSQSRPGPKNKRQRRQVGKRGGAKKSKPEQRIRVQKTILKLAQSDDSDDEDWCSGVPMFRGTARLRQLSESTVRVMEANENINRTLGSPMRISDHEESDDEPPSEEPIEKSIRSSDVEANPPDEAPNTVEEARAMNPPKKIPSVTQMPRVQRVNKPTSLSRILFPKLARFSAPKRRSTLLQNLLTKEIREERSELLQCVRFVCQREFFAQGK